jgi:hypothetical protein
MLSKLQSFAQMVIDSFTVEVYFASGLPKTVLLCPKSPERR